MDIWTNIIESLNSLEVNAVNSVFRLILSILLGVLVGAERKRKGQIAGVRTFALISMGACLAMLLSIYVPQEYLGLKNGDPGRIAAQVITGIGFIGGGAIIQMRGSVRGLTTAAGIWATAIIGMAVGIGMYVIAVSATILVFVILVMFEWYEQWQNMGQESKVISLEVNTIVRNMEPYRKVFREHGVHLSTFYVEYRYDRDSTLINFVILSHVNSDLLPLLSSLRAVNSTKSLTLTSQLEI